MTNQNDRDRVLEAEVERALAPYKDLLPPDMLEVFRAELTRALTDDPTGSRLLRAARPREAPQQSGDVPTNAAGAEVATSDKKKEGRGSKG